MIAAASAMRILPGTRVETVPMLFFQLMKWPATSANQWRGQGRRPRGDPPGVQSARSGREEPTLTTSHTEVSVAPGTMEMNRVLVSEGFSRVRESIACFAAACPRSASSYGRRRATERRHGHLTNLSWNRRGVVHRNMPIRLGHHLRSGTASLSIRTGGRTFQLCRRLRQLQRHRLQIHVWLWVSRNYSPPRLHPHDHPAVDPPVSIVSNPLGLMFKPPQRSRHHRDPSSAFRMTRTRRTRNRTRAAMRKESAVPTRV